MKPVLTHYDVLQVARNAPHAAIRTAYKSLCRKYHPDLHGDGEDTTAMMATINGAYEVLSSPVKRREYDYWLAQHEKPARPARKHPADPTPPPFTSTASTFQSSNLYWHARTIATHVQRNGTAYAGISFSIVLLVAALLGFAHRPSYVGVPIKPVDNAAMLQSMPSPPEPATEPQLSLAKAITPLPARTEAPAYSRAKRAPNGMPWPDRAAYLRNIPILHDGGQETIVLQNRADTDLHVKLFALRGLREYSVREVYLPAQSSFMLKRLTPGRYDLRYRKLDNGRLYRTEEVAIMDSATGEQSRQNALTVQLGQKEGMQDDIFGLLEAEF